MRVDAHGYDGDAFGVRAKLLERDPQLLLRQRRTGTVSAGTLRRGFNRALSRLLSLERVRGDDTSPAALDARVDRAFGPQGTLAHPRGDTDRKLAAAIAGVALTGVAVAGYLTYVHYAGIKPICSASGGCEKVQSSAYSKLAGAPVAVLGLASYLVVLAATLSRTELGRLVACVTALVGCGFSLYLTYRELYTIHAICPWCVSSAVLMTVLAGLTTASALRE